jgi:predicted RNA-binding protein with PUA-like domain
MTAWILKSEPNAYSWDDLVRDKGTCWSGVRNHTAKNNLKAMKKGERCFIYHSGGPKELIGTAEVSREHYPDPTAKPDEGWVAIDVRAREKLVRPVSLAQLKADKTLKKIILVKQSRLSVSPLSPIEEKTLLELART